MADNETPPIMVNPDTVGWDTAMTAMRYVGVIITSFPVLLAVLERRDLAELFVWVRSNEAAPLLSAASSLALLGWGLWKSRHRGKQLVAGAKDPANANMLMKEPVR